MLLKVQNFETDIEVREKNAKNYSILEIALRICFIKKKIVSALSKKNLEIERIRKPIYAFLKVTVKTRAKNSVKQ